MAECVMLNKAKAFAVVIVSACCNIKAAQKERIRAALNVFCTLPALKCISVIELSAISVLG